jgi:hypothetical protein
MIQLTRNQAEADCLLWVRFMPNTAAQVLLTFPPRQIGPEERALLNEWLGRAGDIPLAYVSERRSDDPRFYQRIVIVADPSKRLVYALHAPATASCWVVSPSDQPSHAEVYDTLLDALNSIKAVLT